MRSKPANTALKTTQLVTTELPASEQIDQIVVMQRLYLYNRGLPCGAAALRRHLDDQGGIFPLPPVHRIGRILAQHGLTHARTGWYEGDEPAGLPASARIPIAERRCDILARRAAP